MCLPALLVLGSRAELGPAIAFACVDPHLGSARPGPLSMMPPEDQRAGDVDARIGASDDADQEGEGKVVNGAAPEDKEGQGRQKDGARGDDRSAQSLVQRLVDQIFEGSAHSHLEVFPNAIENQ